MLNSALIILHWVVVKSVGIEASLSWFQILAPMFTNLDKVPINFCVSEAEYVIVTYLRGLLGSS